MIPRLEACYFGVDHDGQWARLASVLSATAAEHCPGWSVRVRSIQPRRHRSALGLQASVANTQKFEEWCRLVAEAEDGQPLLLIDADAAILHPLDDVWVQPFDLAYTTKPGARYPFNGGVLFVRVSEAVRALFATWWEENGRMLQDAEYHRPFRRRYGGLNQASFGALQERGALRDLAVLELPCAEWNCEDASWASFNASTTRILHIKDGPEAANLRKAIFARQWQAPAYVRDLAARWVALESRVHASARRSA